MPPSAALSHVEMQDGKQYQLQTWESWRAGLSNHRRIQVRTGQRPDGPVQQLRSWLLGTKETNAQISVLQGKIYTATSAFTRGMSSDVMYLGSDFSPPEKSQFVFVCVCVLQGAHWIQTNAEPMQYATPHPNYAPTMTV